MTDSSIKNGAKKGKSKKKKKKRELTQQTDLYKGKENAGRIFKSKLHADVSDPVRRLPCTPLGLINLFIKDKDIPHTPTLPLHYPNVKFFFKLTFLIFLFG